MSSAASAVELTARDAAETQRVRDDYMKFFSDVFAGELVELYELDGSRDAVQQLKACVEAGVAVYGHPITLPDPTEVS